MSALVGQVEPELLGPDDAARVVGGEWILRTMEAAGWVKKRIGRNRCVRYLTFELRAAARRLVLEELPDLRAMQAQRRAERASKNEHESMEEPF